MAEILNLILNFFLIIIYSSTLFVSGLLIVYLTATYFKEESFVNYKLKEIWDLFRFNEITDFPTKMADITLSFCNKIFKGGSFPFRRSLFISLASVFISSIAILTGRFIEVGGSLNIIKFFYDESPGLIPFYGFYNTEFTFLIKESLNNST